MTSAIALLLILLGANCAMGVGTRVAKEGGADDASAALFVIGLVLLLAGWWLA